MNYPIYTVGGTPGSGKSTLSRDLAGCLGYLHMCAGGILRGWCQQREHNPTQLPFDEWYASLSQDPSFDYHVDSMMGTVARQQNCLVLEGRVTFYFVPESKRKITQRIYLSCRPEVVAERILTQRISAEMCREEAISEVMEKRIIKKTILSRRVQERSRYLDLYRIDIFDMSNYDVIIDTTLLTPKEVVGRILDHGC